MARSLSSQKRLRQNRVRAARNSVRKHQIKTAIRKVNDAILERNVEAAEKTFREAVRFLDCNSNRNTIHKNTAARRKSRLAKRINALKAAGK
ncbi:MAG: 30S ribosomal protein S20 [Phycisphaerae bacterium]